jgi:hypothetical protein
MKTLIKNKRTYQRRIASADQNEDLIGEELKEDESEGEENGEEGNGNEKGSEKGDADGEEWYDRNSDHEQDDEEVDGDEVDGDEEVNGDEVDGDEEVNGDEVDGDEEVNSDKGMNGDEDRDWHRRQLTWDDESETGTRLTTVVQDEVAPRVMAVPKTIVPTMAPKTTAPKAKAGTRSASAGKAAASKFKFKPTVALAGTKRKAPDDSSDLAEEAVATIGRKNPPRKAQKTHP